MFYYRLLRILVFILCSISITYLHSYNYINYIELTILFSIIFIVFDLYWPRIDFE